MLYRRLKYGCGCSSDYMYGINYYLFGEYRFAIYYNNFWDCQFYSAKFRFAINIGR